MARLHLVDLTGDHLKTPGLNDDISAGDDYTLPQLWSRAIHDCDSRWDGIRYVARQRNAGFAYAIFERCSVSMNVSDKLEGPELDRLCDTFGVDSI